MRTVKLSLFLSPMLAALLFSVSTALADCGDDLVACEDRSEQLETNCNRACNSSSCEDRCSAQAERRLNDCVRIREACDRRPDPFETLRRNDGIIRQFGR